MDWFQVLQSIMSGLLTGCVVCRHPHTAEGITALVASPETTVSSLTLQTDSMLMVLPPGSIRLPLTVLKRLMTTQMDMPPQGLQPNLS